MYSSFRNLVLECDIQLAESNFQTHSDFLLKSMHILY
ncbi:MULTISPECIES: DUF6783 domain-containing protein [Blautia]